MRLLSDLTDRELLSVVDAMTEIDARGRLVVPFHLLSCVKAHAAARNRQQRAQAETRRFVKRDRVVAHAL